jgi:uncharacterized protein with beta-barrel porin domain
MSWSVNAGTLLLDGNITGSGATTVNGGILDVIGSITDLTVNAGGTLTGTGTVGATQVNAGGTLAPGNGTPGSSLTISGNLAFQSGAIYLVQVNATTSSFATVTGTAALGGGTVDAVFANGNVKKKYTILTAAGGVSGTFAPAVNSNLAPGFSTTLSYDANDVFLNLNANLGAGAGLTTNQHNVATSINNFFNSGGTLPPPFLTLFNLTGGALAGTLSQLSGEGATASQQTTFQAMGQFIGLLTDPFMGRGNGINGSNAQTAHAEASNQASAYAASLKPHDAFAMFAKAPPAPFVQRWSVWASGFGGTQTTSGNPVVGSNDTRSSIAGTAVGADYLFSPNTLVGFALAGGGTSFSVNTMGFGRSDLFQAGAYLRHTNGPAYVTAAAAYGWQDITTDRVVTVAGIDHLHAAFNANAWSGRLEGGYRFVVPVVGGVGVTPYAAAQATTFELPSTMETVVAGTSNFALNYTGKDVSDVRSELGIRADKSYPMPNGVLTLRGRVAFAHDYDPDRTISPTFQALPGAGFVVNGAQQARDAALTTSAIEWKWLNGWSAAGTFEGEFSNVTRSYAGKGVVRYQW